MRLCNSQNRLGIVYIKHLPVKDGLYQAQVGLGRLQAPQDTALLSIVRGYKEQLELFGEGQA
jgi:hypothetical protein